ncbi:hypothetical protein [Pedobacter panaciterrae]
MKKTLSLFFIIIGVNVSYAQTNVFPPNGSVGIGTTSPDAALKILRSGANPSTEYSSINIATNGSGNIYGPIIYLDGRSGTSGRSWGLVSSGTLDAVSTGSAGNFAIYDANAGSRLVINSLGNIGIGTLTPTEKLSVNGKVRAHEIKVETANWPDYVFARDYQLTSLKETEQYIKDKGHLPGIPSAEEVKANGVDLGDMNAKLLKKIEELTLYLIEMKKENDIRNAKQEKQIKILQANLNKRR